MSSASTPPRIITLLLNWATANIDKLVRIQWYKGGWEGWAQVELGLMIEDYLAQQTGVKATPYRKLMFREYGVFNDKAKESDITILTDLTPDQPVASKKYAYEIVELKCASWFQDSVAFESQGREAEFVDNFILDITKISSDGGKTLNINPKFKPYEAFAIMMSCNENHIFNCDATIKAKGVMCSNVRKTVATGKSVSIWYVATKYNPDGVQIPTVMT